MNAYRHSQSRCFFLFLRTTSTKTDSRFPSLVQIRFEISSRDLHVRESDKYKAAPQQQEYEKFYNHS